MKVRLDFFEDEVTGGFGLAHYNAIHCETPFNAFFHAIGIFHDVFEHYFEDNHPYFIGKNSFNIGGEMCAMGAFAYFAETLYVQKRRFINIYNEDMTSIHRVMRNSTESLIIEAIAHGGMYYGRTLECGVPYQKPICDSELEYQCELMYKKIKDTEVDGDDLEGANKYKKSVTKQKILNLHRYGYRMAENLVPTNQENRIKLNDFIKYFEDFCKYHNAEELYKNFTSIEFEITKKKDIIDWKAILISRYENDVDITNDFSNEHIMDSQLEFEEN